MSISISKSLAKKKSLVEYLRQTYGLNISKIFMSSRVSGLNPYSRVVDVPEYILTRLERFLNANFITGRILRQTVNKNIRKLVETGSYRGLRISQGLPAHGQRTHTNAKTAKTVRKSVSVVKSDSFDNINKYAKHVKTSAYGSRKLSRTSKNFLAKTKKHTTSKKKK